MDRKSAPTNRLVVVSNRVAVPGAKGGAGGVAVGLQHALKNSGGIWFGWSGKVVEQPSEELHMAKAARVTYATVDLSTDEHADYYNGYANRTLWALFHYRIDLAAFDRSFYPGYQAVNAKFARLLSPLLKPTDMVWVHDYHLVPLADELRAAGCRMPLGFFLHIPFPAPQVFATLYNHKRLVRQLLAYDLIGFQTEPDVEAFTGIVRELGGEVVAPGVVRAFGRTVHVRAFPIGIDVHEVAAVAAAGPSRTETLESVAGVGDRKMIIGVDRLDYSKGLPMRLDAFEMLLTTHPELTGRVTMCEIAAPTREDVPEYVKIRQELETAAGSINGRYGELDWEPVRYINRAYSRTKLAALYRASAAALVTPLRDGMNLVAKEFVAAQDPADPGVLILSRFAGAAQQMKQALVVNPYDVEEMATAMQTALNMPLAERQQRWRVLMNGLEAQDLTWWRNAFIDSLAEVARAA